MKKVFSLLLVVAMLVSLSLVASAAPANEAGGMHTVITETDEGITVTVYANNVVNCNGFLFQMLSDAIAYKDGLEVNAAFDSKLNATNESIMKFSYGMTTTNYITEAGSTKLLSFNATKVNPAAELSEADFAYGIKINNLSKVTTTTGSTVAGISAGTSNFATNKSAAQAYFTIDYVDDRAPVVVEPDFKATVAGTTITCTGKVDATVENYGVVFTAESTVTGDRAQKYYGAMNGNTVSDGADGTTTFTFGDWDGTFEIILEGVHAGTKVLNFFANDTIITEADTFTLTVE